MNLKAEDICRLKKEKILLENELCNLKSKRNKTVDSLETARNLKSKNSTYKLALRTEERLISLLRYEEQGLEKKQKE